MRQTLRSALVVAAIAMSPVAASAASATYTVTGKVHSSVNNTGEFGLSGVSSLDGLSYTAVFTVTVPTVGAEYTEVGDYFSNTQGGGYYGTPSPVSSVFTLNGVSLFAGDYIGYAGAVNNTFFSSYEYINFNSHHSAISGNVRQSNYVTMLIDSYSEQMMSSGSLINGFAGFLPGRDQGLGYFQLSDEDLQGRSLRNAYGYLTVERVVMGAGTAVPEPATWALLIAGFGLMGAALRGRSTLRA